MYLSGFFENIYAAFELLMILIADLKIDTRVLISHDLHKNKNTYFKYSYVYEFSKYHV